MTQQQRVKQLSCRQMVAVALPSELKFWLTQVKTRYLLWSESFVLQQALKRSFIAHGWLCFYLCCQMIICKESDILQARNIPFTSYSGRIVHWFVTGHSCAVCTNSGENGSYLLLTKGSLSYHLYVSSKSVPRFPSSSVVVSFRVLLLVILSIIIAVNLSTFNKKYSIIGKPITLTMH